MLKQLRKFFPGDEWLPAKRQVTGKEGEWWKKLHRGSKLTFAQMSQVELSSKELIIGETCRYDFGSAHFVAYILEKMDARLGDMPVAQIIVADGRRDECYLAISRKLTAVEQSHLLDDVVLAGISRNEMPEKLFIRATGAVAFATWAVENYRKQIHGIRGKKTLGGCERYFEYALFVSHNNERAVEVELYEDGSCDMYLTIYRPASDIASIFHATRFDAVEKAHPVLVKNDATGFDVPSFMGGNTPVLEKPKVEPEVITGSGLADIRAQIQLTLEQEREKLRAHPSISSASVATETAEQAAQVLEVITAKDLPSAPDNHEVLARIAADMADIADVAAHAQQGALLPDDDDLLEDEENSSDGESSEELMRTLQEVAAAVDSGDDEKKVVIAGADFNASPVQIDCHIRVAARLIDEALRRDMRLEDVVRKALGLPIAPEEKVTFTMHLSEKEYQDLAERFECSPKDKQAIHAAIVEDLIDFSGERAKLDALKPSVKAANA